MDRQSGPRIVIDGFGLITPLGLSAWRTFRALLAGRTLTNRPQVVEGATNHAAGGEDDQFAWAQHVGGIGLSANRGVDPTVELAERAGREALWMAGRSPQDMPTWLGTSKGAFTSLCRIPTTTDPDRLTEDQALAVALGPHGYLNHHLARRMGLRIQGHTVAACSSSLAALDRARAHLIQSAKNDVDSSSATLDFGPSTLDSNDTALVLTADSALDPLLIASYRRLGILAPLTREGYKQSPLDESRAGFILSQIGAAVVLRRLPPGDKPAPGQIELLDTALANDANDLVRPDPGMPALRQLAGRMSAHHPLDMIHPHAPATADHDPVELRACAQSARMNDHADLYAAKGALGHSLGAAGLTSLILAALSLHTGRRPPMPWLRKPIAELNPWLKPNQPDHDLANTQSCSRTGTHAIFSAGFAAHHAAAVIQRHE